MPRLLRHLARLASGVQLGVLIALPVIPMALADAPAYVTTRILSEEAANDVAAAAALRCREMGFQTAVAVTDRGGRLLAFLRNPLAGPHTVDISQRKAYSAATYQSATSALADRNELAATPGVFLVGGGVPILVGGHFYGAVGVSGAPRDKAAGDNDEACAQAGIDAIRERLEFAD